MRIETIDLNTNRCNKLYFILTRSKFLVGAMTVLKFNFNIVDPRCRKTENVERKQN